MNAGYPKRTVCQHCFNPLRQDGPDAQWVDPWDGWECPQAPNPEDGPMPPHQPGTVLSPSSPRTCMAIARQGDGYGQCTRTLSADGRCDRAADHV